jgi:DNA replication factor CDT1 like.
VKEPAYKRYADLTAIQEKGTLNLPFKYRMLAEIFRAVDTIVSMIHTRGENITFEKLQAGVQSMIKK